MFKEKSKEHRHGWLFYFKTKNIYPKIKLLSSNVERVWDTENVKIQMTEKWTACIDVFVYLCVFVCVLQKYY